MNFLEFTWLKDESSLKEALQNGLHCSGQLLKKHFSSKQLTLPQKAHSTVKLPLDLVNHLRVNPVYKGPPMRVLHETTDYIAIHKPPGIHSHPLCYSDQDTVLNFLIQEKKWAALFVNEQNYDRGLLYRLDLETSGVIVLAKNEGLYARMRNDFNLSVKRKLYWAIVEGSFNREGEWTHYFRSTGLKGIKQKVTLDPQPDARVGTLMVKKMMEVDGKSLVLVDLKSGVRHQIRAQMAELGFPLLGDELYGGKAGERLFLHAWRYEWDNCVEEDNGPELFGSFLDLNRCLQMGHDMIRCF